MASKTARASKSSDERIMTRNITKGAGGKRISRARYDAIRDAILQSVPARGDGILFTRLFDAVQRRVPKDLFADASVNWYTTTVKLDLEARGLIARVPGSRPQRLRRGRPG